MLAKIVFMGTPDFAVPSLHALIDEAPSAGSNLSWQVVGVVTQPDRPSGRGKKLSPPPVKVLAQNNNIPVLQPPSLKKEAAFKQLAALAPDLIVVAAFGQILRQNVLDLPPHGCLNVHASLLPRWRGAAPVRAAIHAGDAETGVTIMQMDVGLDTGPMLTKKSMPITADETAGALTDKLAHLGANLLVETVPAWLRGELTPQPQDESLATLAPRLQKEDGEIDWSLPAVAIERMIRALSPWPSAYTFGPRGQIKILAATPASPEVAANHTDMLPGTVFKHHKAPHVVTGRGVLRLITVQPAGKRAMAAKAMLNGQPELWGYTLGAAR